ncbi:MAG: Rieske 2Fe-2S domain-containing protein [Spirochaetaceae bacterium]|nr:Rieske 2Fe-2S domain-containing protein [Spirochaetaceae bacterium]
MSARRRAAAARYVVAGADEIAPGERKIVTVAGRSIGVFNLGGEYFALRNRCPHQGGKLCEGQLWGVLQSERPGEFDYQPSREVLACPWHGWEFHLRTGQSWCAPDKLRVSRYAVATVTGADLVSGNGPPDDAGAPAPGMVKGPYVAETYPVKRDGAYLVVELPTGERPTRMPAAGSRPPESAAIPGGSSGNP